MTIYTEWKKFISFLCLGLIACLGLWQINLTFFILFFGLMLLMFRGLVFGILNIIFIKKQKRHVEIEKNSVGFGKIQPKRWISVDGIRKIRNNKWGTFSIEHCNGTILDIPSGMLLPKDMEILNKGMTEYHVYQKKYNK